MKLKKLFAATLAVAMMGSLAACGSKSSGNSSTGSTSGTEKLDAEQNLNTYLASEPSTLDPSKCNDGYGITILYGILEPLTRVEENKDKKTKVAPAAAKSWESNDDGTVWTFHLRDNTWSDGKKVTAQDYAYGISRVVNPDTGSQFSYMLTPIKNAEKITAGKLPISDLGVKAVDNNTLQITLESSTPYFLALTYSNSMFPVREDLVKKYGDKFGTEANTLVSNGPFTIKSWTHNSEIVLQNNDKYWDKKSVKLQTVDYKILTDDNARYNSFYNGSLDVTQCVVAKWIKKFKAMDNVDYTYYLRPSTDFTFFNAKDKLFKNVHIRRAFTLAIDREDVVKTIYDGTKKATYSWIPPQISSGELGEYRAQVKTEPLKDLTEKYPDAKTELLKGMKELNLGSDPSTLKISLSLGGTTQFLRNWGEYMQQTYKKVLGVQINLNYNKWATFLSRVSAGNYQIAYEVWSIDYNDPMAMLSIMTSNSKAIPTNWSDPKYDALVKQANSEMDEAKRVKLYQQAEELLLVDDTVLAPITNSEINRFNKSYVKNLCTNYYSSNTTGLKYVYISGRK